MSREIKFRTWNSVTKEMEQVTQINLKNHYVQTTFNKIGYSYGQPDDVIVEQYTGLEDANGKEIYEGDIIKVSDETGSLFVSVVKYFYYDDYPAFDLDPQYIPTNWYFEANILSTLKDDGTEIKVVGNVHANPELLEDKC